MRLDLLLELHDSPGQLSQALATVGRFGGNVLTVLHEHGKRRGEWVPVRIVLDVPKEGQDQLLAAVRSEFRLLSVSGAVATVPFAFLLLGHVFESQVQEITDAIFQTGVEVRRFSAEIVARDQHSAALVELAAPDQESLRAARTRIRELAAAKGLVVVEALGGASP